MNHPYHSFDKVRPGPSANSAHRVGWIGRAATALTGMWLVLPSISRLAAVVTYRVKVRDHHPLMRQSARSGGRQGRAGWSGGMSTVTFCRSAPSTAASSRLCSTLILAGATEGASSRPASLYDLMCNLDDTTTMRTAHDRATDPVTLSALDSELAKLDAEHTDIHHAPLTRFHGVDHDHICRTETAPPPVGPSRVLLTAPASGRRTRKSPTDEGSGRCASSATGEHYEQVCFAARLAARWRAVPGGRAEPSGWRSEPTGRKLRRYTGAGKRRRDKGRDDRASRQRRAVRTLSLFLRLSRSKRCRRAKRACPQRLTRQNAQDHERGVHTSGSTSGATLDPPVQTTVQATVGATLFRRRRRQLAQPSRADRTVELPQKVLESPTLALRQDQRSRSAPGTCSSKIWVNRSKAV